MNLAPVNDNRLLNGGCCIIVLTIVMNLQGKVIDKSTRVPLYFQLKELLSEHIRESKHGDPIPTENALCDQFGVSRPTVRQAVSELVAEGYLIKIQGRGTFVSKQKLQRDFRLAFETFEKEILSRGRKPETRILELTAMPAGEDLSDELNIGVNDEVYLLRRLRFTDGVPLMTVDNYLPADLVPGFTENEDRLKALHHTLENHYGFRLDRALRSIEAIRAPKRVADLLEIEEGDPVQFIRTRVYLSNGRTIHYSEGWYRGDQSSFTIELHRNPPDSEMRTVGTKE